MSAQPFPIRWILLGQGAPSEPGVYLRAADVAGWLRSVGEDDLAELLDDESQWPASETVMVRSSWDTPRDALRKARTLARGPRRYRRKVASPKQWQAIIAAKAGTCRVCVSPMSNGSAYYSRRIQFHHLVARAHGGDDVEDNLVPLCGACHYRITTRDATAARTLCESLTDAEYAYAIERGGEGFFERAYGVRYER